MRQVDLEVADAELVPLARVGDARRRVGPVADTVAEADVEPREGDGDGGERRDDDQREEGRQGDDEPAAPARPEEDETGDEDQEPGRPCARPRVGAGEGGEDRDGDQAERDQARRMVAALLEDVFCDRALVALLGHHEDGGDVDEDSRSAEQGQDDETEAEDRRCDVEVPPETAGNARDPSVAPDALEALDHWGVKCVFAHASRVPARASGDHPE